MYEEPSNNEDEKEARPKNHHPPEFYEEAFEKKAIAAFLQIRRNADIFVNLLTLMLVCDLEELD